MAEELNHETFDLAAVLSGIDYPEEEVHVYFNQKLGYAINRLNEAIAEAERREDSDTAKELQGDLDELLDKVKDSRYTLLIRGISEGTRRGILKNVREEFPPKRNMLGMEEDNLEADEAFTRRLWSVSIVKVTDPSGAISLMSEELAQLLQDKAPAPAQEAINSAMAKLSDGSKAGFEFAAQEVDFL